MYRYLALLLLSVYLLLSPMTCQQQSTGPPCSCERNGNTHTVTSVDNCTTFIQSTALHPDRLMNCPAGLRFNIDSCVCDYQTNTDCPAACPGKAVVLPATQSCADNDEVSKLVNASLEAGECITAARTILTHELSCKLDNRLDALAGTFKFFSGYFTSGCRVTEELISPLFPEACRTLYECTTTKNPEMDFYAGCGDNDQTRFNVLGCYAEFAAAGCELAATVLKRMTKFMAMLCPRSCEVASADSRTKNIAKMMAEAGRCDLVIPLMWDDLVECDDKANLEGAYLMRLDWHNFISEHCPSYDSQGITIDSHCFPHNHCFHTDENGQVICGDENANVERTVDCLAVLTNGGCDASQRLSDRFTAHARRVCPVTENKSYETTKGY